MSREELRDKLAAWLGPRAHMTDLSIVSRETLYTLQEPMVETPALTVGDMRAILAVLR